MERLTRYGRFEGELIDSESYDESIQERYKGKIVSYDKILGKKLIQKGVLTLIYILKDGKILEYFDIEEVIEEEEIEKKEDAFYYKREKLGDSVLERQVGNQVIQYYYDKENIKKEHRAIDKMPITIFTIICKAVDEGKVIKLNVEIITKGHLENLPSQEDWRGYKEALI